ncbi:MAG: hypothetical protein GY720_23485 [bacterium]|nr:hypothetical protein [bacterium]
MSDEPVGDGADVAATASAGNVEEELKWPIGFITILVLAALYLGWRLIQLLGRILDLMA